MYLLVKKLSQKSCESKVTMIQHYKPFRKSEPTRIAQSSATLIDHVYCFVKAFVKKAGIANLHLLDHSLIYCVLNINGRGLTGSTKRLQFQSFAKVDLSSLKADVQLQL